MPLIIPRGFAPQASAPGIAVWRKDYRGGQPDYVTVIRLAEAGVLNLCGASNGSPSGAATVARKPLLGRGWWEEGRAIRPARAVHVAINGTFFETAVSPTRLSFGLRVEGRNISYGYGLNEYPGLTQMLIFDNQTATADIIPWNGDAFGRYTNIVGVLDTRVSKSARTSIARTLVGVCRETPRSPFQTMLWFSSAYSTQTAAANILTAFGAEKVALLDSGGSSGFVINGRRIVAAQRTLPHALVAYSK